MTGVFNCSMFCFVILYVHSSFAIIVMGKRELVALLKLPSLRLVIVVLLLLTMSRVCIQFVIVVFPDHTHLLVFTITEFYHLKSPKSGQHKFVLAVICSVVSF